MRNQIVCLDGFATNPGDLSWDLFEGFGNFKVYDRCDLGKDQVIERAKEARIIMTNKVKIDKEVIDNCPDLQAIMSMATGYNHIDIEYAKSKNIVVCNVPGYSTNSVAELVISFMLILARSAQKMSQDVTQNNGWSNAIDWTYVLFPQVEMARKKIGIIGFGNIGQQVGRIAHAFGMEVLTVNRGYEYDVEYPYVATDFRAVLRDSDFITLHCPLTAETENLINDDAFMLMKETAFLINTARGAIINEADLFKALSTNEIAGAALDVMCEEPPKVDHPLFALENCIITPHIAWATFEARQRSMDIILQNIKEFMHGEPQNVVNPHETHNANEEKQSPTLKTMIK